jgi:hypothetical protein
MSPEHFQREKMYQTARAAADKMLREGVITPGDMSIIDTRLRAKYKPYFGGLYPPKSLLLPGDRGNMHSEKGGAYEQNNT